MALSEQERPLTSLAASGQTVLQSSLKKRADSMLLQLTSLRDPRA